FLDALRELIAHCRTAGVGGYTPSDFPLARLDQETLDRLSAVASGATGVNGAADGIEDVYPLSTLQQGIVFHSLDRSRGEYFVQQVLELHGALDREAFERAWSDVIARHVVLRTSVLTRGLDDPLQVVHARVAPPLEVHDWRDRTEREREERLEELLGDDRRRGFDLGVAPLMRMVLIRFDDEVHRLVWSHHHLLMDGWSVFLVLRDVLAFYDAARRGEALELAEPPPYRDYIAWLQRQDRAATERFWRERLAGFREPTPLFVDEGHDGHEGDEGKGRARLDGEVGGDGAAVYGEHELRLAAGTTAALRGFARGRQLTLNTIVQGAWALLLGRYSGEPEVLFGSTVSGRSTELPGVESMVGLLISTLPVRVRVDGSQRLVPWLRALQDQLADLRQHEHSALAEIKAWSEVPPRRSLFDSLFVFENYPVDREFFEEREGRLEIVGGRAIERTNFPLTLLVGPGEELEVNVCYHGHRFTADVIERLCGHLRTLLEGIVSDPERRLSELPMLPEPERRQLVDEWNDTAREYPQAPIHAQFEARAAQTPDAAAVIFPGPTTGDGDAGETLSYAELDARANRLAHHLLAQGVQPGALVGLCVERSPRMLEGLLAILKCGAAYVPLDPGFPVDRLAYMVEDAGLEVVVSETRLSGLLPSTVRLVSLDASAAEIERCSPERPEVPTSVDDRMYVIYTSGSTGRPKGVEIAHRSVSNFLASMAREPGFAAGERLLAVTTLSFDISNLELLLPLVAGGTVIVASSARTGDGAALKGLLARYRPEVMQATPATWRLLLLSGWEGDSRLRIFSGGEALPRELADSLLERGREVWNLYGPTETTIWSAV
ncbi:MAG: condensation domain-containing protein, partial [Myxococcota bacterium]